MSSEQLWVKPLFFGCSLFDARRLLADFPTQDCPEGQGQGQAQNRCHWPGVCSRRCRAFCTELETIYGPFPGPFGRPICECNSRFGYLSKRSLFLDHNMGFVKANPQASEELRKEGMCHALRTEILVRGESQERRSATSRFLARKLSCGGGGILQTMSTRPDSRSLGTRDPISITGKVQSIQY